MIKIKDLEEQHEEPCDDVYCDECIEKKAEDGDINADDEGFMIGYNGS